MAENDGVHECRTTYRTDRTMCKCQGAWYAGISAVVIIIFV